MRFAVFWCISCGFQSMTAMGCVMHSLGLMYLSMHLRAHDPATLGRWSFTVPLFGMSLII